jgi:hypothetical protein
MEEIVPNTDNIVIEGQTSNSASNMGEGQGNSDTEEQIANFISEELTNQWLIEFKTTFERHEVREVRNDVLVMKLPACFRVPSEQYTPRYWHFGLHNRDVPHLSESEDRKVALATACELGPWEEFCFSVVDDPVDVLRAYGLDLSEPKFGMRQVQYIITLDALTIFLVLAYRPFVVFEKMPRKVARLIRARFISWGYANLVNDLLLLENQISIALLTKVISKCYEKWKEPNPTLMEPEHMLDRILKANVFDMCEFIFVLTQDHRAKIEMAYPQGELEKCPHILACVLRILCGQNLKRRSGATTIRIQSATALKKAGIQIKGIEGVLDEVGFRKRCLFLPIVKLYDQTESDFRNLAMYEYMEDFTFCNCPFGEYLRLMTELIKEVGDVSHLIDCGVIQNELRTHNNAFEMWTHVQSDLYLNDYSKEYEDMVSKINKECKSSLYVMRTEFYQLFCSRPWYVIGAITATIVTVATCIQAYTSVIGSDKMQPHFPP